MYLQKFQLHCETYQVRRSCLRIFVSATLATYLFVAYTLVLGYTFPALGLDIKTMNPQLFCQFLVNELDT